MTTSGSANYSRSGGDIVRAAYRIVHNISSAYTLKSDEMADGLEALNMLIKNLQGPPNPIFKGVKTWQRETASITLAAKIEYSLKSSGGDLDINIPVKILEAHYYRDSSDTETLMRYLQYLEWRNLPDKTATGTPSRYNYEKRLDEGLFRLDVIPTASIIAAGDTIKFSYLTPLEDLDTISDDVYFPAEWFRPLKWLLAQEWLPEVGKQVPPDVAALAQQSTEVAESVDLQETTLYFEPDNPESW